jgi:hypothetical protein
MPRNRSTSLATVALRISSAVVILAAGPASTALSQQPSYLEILEEANVGHHSAATIGADGRALISYYDTTEGDLKVAHCSNAACTSATITTLDSTGDVGQYSALAIGSDGLATISYYDVTNSNLKVAHCSNTICTSATVTTLDSTGDVGALSSMAVGRGGLADGLPLISYYDATNSDLKVAHCSNTACTSSTITTVDADGVFAEETATAIGTDGRAIIGYGGRRNAAAGGGSILKVAHCSDAACTSATITTPDAERGGMLVSVAVGTDGRALITHVSASGTNELKVAHCSDADCTSATITTIDHWGSHTSTDVAVGADGLGLISYVVEGRDLKVAHCSNAACTSVLITTLDKGTADSSQVKMRGSIAVGADRLPLITYYDAANSALKVAHCSNDHCMGATTFAVLDSGDDALGRNASMAVRSDGDAIIIYDTGSSKGPTELLCDTVKCGSPTRRSANWTGEFNPTIAVAMAPYWRTLMAHYSPGGHDLRFRGWGWSVEGTTVDSTGDVGQDPFLAIGADGLPLISYYDATNAALKVAHCTDLTCERTVITTLDKVSVGSVGRHSAIVVGTDGLALISYAYSDNSRTKVRLAHCSNLECTAATKTDTASSKDGSSSTAIGGDGLALISYYDNQGVPRVRHCSDTACTYATEIALESASTGGRYTAVARGVDGLGVVAYDDVAHHALKLAHCSDLSCSRATVTTVQGVTAGEYISLAMDKRGQPVIVYRDPLRSAVAMAHCTNRFCIPYAYLP